MNKQVELIIGCQGIATSDDEKFTENLENLIVSVLKKNNYSPDDLIHVSDVLDSEGSSSKISCHLFTTNIGISGGFSAERKNIMNALIDAGKELGTYTSWLVHINGNKENK